MCLLGASACTTRTLLSLFDLLVFDPLWIAIIRQVQLNAVLESRLEPGQRQREALRGIGDVARELIGIPRPPRFLHAYEGRAIRN